MSSARCGSEARRTGAAGSLRCPLAPHDRGTHQHGGDDSGQKGKKPFHQPDSFREERSGCQHGGGVVSGGGEVCKTDWRRQVGQHGPPHRKAAGTLGKQGDGGARRARSLRAMGEPEGTQAKKAGFASLLPRRFGQLTGPEGATRIPSRWLPR